MSILPENWDQKVIDLGGSILQSWIWGEFMKSLRYDVQHLSGKDYVNLMIAMPLPLGKKNLYSPRGPLGDVSASLNEIEKISQTDKDIIFARVEPKTALDLPHAAKDVQPKHNWVLHLDKTNDELLAGMKPKHRYNLNLSTRKGVVVREGSKADLLGVFKLLLETSGRNRFHIHPQNYYFLMFEVLSPKFLKVLVAEHDGKLLAASFLSLFGGTATYLHGASSAKNKEMMAPFALHWEGIKLAKNLGLKKYDFGGVHPDPNHPWAGITRFKKGFGGFQVDYPGTYDLVFSPLWYNVYKNVRNFRKIFRI